MSTWTLVARREMAAKLRDRNFIVATVILLVVIVASIAVPVLIMGSSSERYDVAVIGNDRAAARIVKRAATGSPSDAAALSGGRADISTTPVADRAAAAEAVRSGDADAALVADGKTWQLLADGSPALELSSAISTAVQDVTLDDNAARLGTSVEKLKQGGDVVTVDLGAGDAAGDDTMRQMVSKGVGMGMALLFYLAAIMFGTQIASSVVEEKQSRIIEILAAMIPLRQLLLGKVVGNTIIAFGQLVLMAATAVLAGVGVFGGLLGPGSTGGTATTTSPAGQTTASLPVDIAGLLAGIAWYIPFFVLGFLALACIWAAAGAMASRNEDLQATTMPLTMTIMVLFFAALYAGGMVKKVLSFVPIASTIVMPMRIVEGDYAWWEPIVALLLVILFAAGTVAFGARLYERAVMHSGGALSWRSALKLSR